MTNEALELEDLIPLKTNTVPFFNPSRCLPCTCGPQGLLGSWGAGVQSCMHDSPRSPSQLSM